MPTYWFPPDEKVPIGYTVTVTGGATQADESTAEVFANGDATGSALYSEELKKVGEGTLELDLSKHTITESPLGVRFTFKQGEKSTQAGPLLRALAEPAVAKVKASVVEAKVGDAIDLSVEEWGAWVHDQPPPAAPRLDKEAGVDGRFPSGKKDEVKWAVVVEGTIPREIATGQTASFTVAEEHLGKELSFEGWIDLEAGKPEKVPSVKVVVPKLELLQEGQPPADTIGLGDEVKLEAKLSPGFPGEFAWTATGDAVQLEGNGPRAIVKGVAASGAKDDVTIKCTFTSEETGTAYEVEHKLTVDELEIEEPKPDTVWLVGTRLPLTAKWKHGGAAEVPWVLEHHPDLDAGEEGWKPGKAEGTKHLLDRDGSYRLNVAKGRPKDAWVKFQAVAPDVVELTYVGAKKMVDGPDPSSPAYVRADGRSDPTTLEPAWYLAGSELKVKAKVKGKKDLTQSQKLALEATGQDDLRGGKENAAQGKTKYDPLELTGSPADVTALTSGVEVELTCGAPLAACGAYDGRWHWKVGVDGAAPTPATGDPTRFRVLVTYKEPIFQVNYGGYRSQPSMVTKRHIDAAARWAAMMDSNVGKGLCYALDNNLRHWAAWDDQKTHVESGVIIVPDYATGAAKPKNYDVVNSFSSVRDGRRTVSKILYPMESSHQPRFHSLVKYEDYQYNYGWKVLDNPDFPGGRCNQQAALIVDVIGTHGVKAEVLYLQRVGRAKTNGRPVRQYFCCYQGGEFWNFHGVVKAEMDDGSWWCYDGSFSSPPSRKNGSQTEFEKAPGPFIHAWSDWSYDDDQADSDRATHGSRLEEYGNEIKARKKELEETRAKMKALRDEHPRASADRKKEIEREDRELRKKESDCIDTINARREDWAKGANVVLQEYEPDNYKADRNEAGLRPGDWTGVPE